MITSVSSGGSRTPVSGSFISFSTKKASSILKKGSFQYLFLSVIVRLFPIKLSFQIFSIFIGEQNVDHKNLMNQSIEKIRNQSELKKTTLLWRMNWSCAELRIKSSTCFFFSSDVWIFKLMQAISFSLLAPCCVSSERRLKYTSHVSENF